MSEIKLFQGDCLNIMATMPERSIDLCVTDIPYDVINRKSNGLRQLDKGKADTSTFKLGNFLELINRLITGSVYIFCATEQVSEIRSTLIDYGFTTRLIIWEKTNPSPMNGQHIWLSGVECCVFGKRAGGYSMDIVTTRY